MTVRIHKVPMPEGGMEREFQKRLLHNCPNAKVMRRVLEADEADILYFNVGSHGEGMPLHTPFIVNSTFDCRVCGEYAHIWVEWTGRLVFL